MRFSALELFLHDMSFLLICDYMKYCRFLYFYHSVDFWMSIFALKRMFYTGDTVWSINISLSPGNPRDAGVLPRGLDVLFNSISGKQWPGMDLKPGMFNDVVKLSPEDEEKERKIKERTLKLNCGEVRMWIYCVLFCEDFCVSFEGFPIFILRFLTKSEVQVIRHVPEFQHSVHWLGAMSGIRTFWRVFSGTFRLSVVCLLSLLSQSQYDLVTTKQWPMNEMVFGSIFQTWLPLLLHQYFQDFIQTENRISSWGMSVYAQATESFLSKKICHWNCFVCKWPFQLNS